MDNKINENINLEEKYNISCFQSIKEAASFEPVFSIVANPTSLHIKTAQELIDHNIPVLMEKPISNNDVGLDGLIQTAKSRNIPVMVGYMMRFHPCAIKLKKYLENKVLGRIYSINVTVNSYMPTWHQYENYNEFYAGMKSMGGGVVLTEIHEIDLLNWYFGAPRKIYAIGGKLSQLNFDVEDTVSILMEQKTKNGFFPITISMSFVQKSPLRKILILGEYGKIEWDISKSELLFDNYEHDIHEKNNYPEFERNQMFIEQLNHVIECIKQKSKSFISLSNVIGGHRTALAIKDSLKKKSIIIQ